MTPLRILATSDIHDDWNQILGPSLYSLPKADVCVIAGDLTERGIFNLDKITLARQALRALSLRYSLILWIPGNHDFGLDSPVFKGIPNAIMLTKEPFLMRSLVPVGHAIATAFIGVPLSVCYEMPSLAFTWCHMTDDPQVERLAFDLPFCDILVAHSPPYGVCDADGYDIARKETAHVGSPELLAYIARHHPKLVICGHARRGSGEAMVGTTRVVNVARRWELLEVEL